MVMAETAGIRRDRRTLVARTREDLVRRIRQGEFKPGQQLPSEPDLARAYDVSRVTVREALKGLQQEHLVYVVHGRGTFVADTPITRPVTRLQSVTELVADLGYTMITTVLGAQITTEPGAATEALGVADGTPLVHLERLRRVDGRPAIYSIDVFPAGLVGEDLPVETWQGSLFALIEGRSGLRITHTTATLRAVLLDGAIRERIGASSQTPWLLMEQVNYSSENRPVIFSHDYHHGEMFSFDVVRRRA
jgi:GntR family transcriptional regulator